MVDNSALFCFLCHFILYYPPFDVLLLYDLVMQLKTVRTTWSNNFWIHSVFRSKHLVEYLNIFGYLLSYPPIFWSLWNYFAYFGTRDHIFIESSWKLGTTIYNNWWICLFWGRWRLKISQPADKIDYYPPNV